METKGNFYVIDTSSLLFDHTALDYFKDGYIIIPVSVLEELDKHKDRLDEVGASARAINRKLYELKKQGNLSDGVRCGVDGPTVKIVVENPSDIPSSLCPELPDNKILSVALNLNKQRKSRGRTFLVTNDLNLGLKSEAYSVPSFEFKPSTKYQVTKYMGWREISETNEILIDEIYAKGKIATPKALNAIENEYFLITDFNKQKSVRCVNRSGYLVKVKDPKIYKQVKPLNNQQFYALDLLLNPDIKLITLTGPAGTGKSLISVAAGLFQCIESSSRKYDRFLISRSLVLMSGKDKLGFLKGGLKEKLEPYLLPLKDAIDQVMGKDADAFAYLTGGDLELKSNKPKIEIEPLQYIRGRSLKGCYFLIDETQNLTVNELKTIITRIGDGSKIILLGDLEQIDSPYLTKENNGLAQVIEKFKGSSIAGHISLVDGVRSELATEAAKRL